MKIRKIDISKLDKIDRDTGPEPKLDFVPIDKLVVDEGYQRNIEQRGWNNIKKIAEHFDWARFSPLMVAKRDDGTFAIIDGQHRAHAAALRGVARVPALVSDLTPEQQASAFSWINGTVTALTPNQIYRAALAAFEPWAVQCQAVVARAGCELMTYNANSSNKKPGQVFAISAVRKFVDANQSQYLLAVLAGIKASACSNEVRYYNTYGIKALVPAAISLGVTRSEVIADFLNAHDLENTASKVRSIMDLPEHRNSSFQALFAKSILVLMKQFVDPLHKEVDKS